MVDLPMIEPTITLGSIGIMLTVGGSISTAVWFIIKVTSQIQHVFGAIEKSLALLKSDNQTQDTRLGAIEFEIKKLTDIVANQAVLNNQVSMTERRVDLLYNRVDRLIEDIGRTRVGHDLSRVAGGLS